MKTSLKRRSDGGQVLKSMAMMALAGLLVVGCSRGESQQELAALSSSQFVDQASNDTATLKASLGERVSVSGGEGSLAIDLKLCKDGSVSGGAMYRWFDCTEALEKIKGVPAIESVGVYANEPSPGYYSSQFFCRFVDIETVTRTAALDSPVFNGLGFWNGTSYTTRLVAKDRLKEARRVRLKSGDEAAVHRFFGIGGCWQGSSSSSAYGMVYFKAFAQFNDGSTLFKNWETVDHNHGIGFYYPGFDRSGELLQ